MRIVDEISSALQSRLEIESIGVKARMIGSSAASAGSVQDGYVLAA